MSYSHLKVILEYSMRDENLGIDFTRFVTKLVNPKEQSHLKAV